jgi:hypothetical protein
MANTHLPSQLSGKKYLASYLPRDEVGTLTPKGRAVVELARLLIAEADQEQLRLTVQGAAALGVTHTELLRTKLFLNLGVGGVDLEE